MFSKEELV